MHRDLKGANVVITEAGRAKVLDFGIARRMGGEELETVTRSGASLGDAGSVAGTLPYMAPEVLRGEPADARPRDRTRGPPFLGPTEGRVHGPSHEFPGIAAEGNAPRHGYGSIASVW